MLGEVRLRSQALLRVLDVNIRLISTVAEVIDQDNGHCAPKNQAMCSL